MVMDCILVEPDEWWVGYHQAQRVATRWPGGMLELKLPPHAVSRAWLKMEESLRWSELPIADGGRCAEIGSAPGGASQALLDRGIVVTGIDPAEMAPEVLQHPNFTHLRRRANQVKRREFRKIRWLTADMNVAPRYTLDVVEEIVTHPQINIRGMLLTLKLFRVGAGGRDSSMPRADSRVGFQFCPCAAIAIQPPGDLRGGDAETISSQADFQRNRGEIHSAQLTLAWGTPIMDARGRLRGWGWKHRELPPSNA